jgi:hypothetical protein
MRACLPPSRTHQTSYPLPERLGYCAPASQRGHAPYSVFADQRQSFVDSHGSAYDRARSTEGAVADFLFDSRRSYRYDFIRVKKIPMRSD